MGPSNDKNADRKKPFSLIERIGAVTGGASAILLVFSVFYDYNYLLALGLTFNEVPTTIADHVRSAIVWLPRVLRDFATGTLLMVFLAMAGMDLARISVTAADAQQILATPPDAEAPAPPRRRWPALVRVLAALAMSSVLGVVAAALAIFNPGYFYMAAMLVWIATLFWIDFPILRAVLAQQGVDAYFRVIVLAPLYLCYVGARGYREGSQLLQAGGAATWVSVAAKDDVKAQEVAVAGVRRFGAVAVLAGLDGTVTVLPAEHIRALRKGAARQPAPASDAVTPAPPR